MRTDDDLPDDAPHHGGTCFHAGCTCVMGQRRLVHVVDASIMPAVTSTNTNTPTILIAENGAVMIKAVARERLTA
jgi:choline dehydrogenase